MEYQEFLGNVRDLVQKKVGENGRVNLAQVLKNNRSSIDTMTILNGKSNVSPAIYMDRYYQNYLDGDSIETIAEQIEDFHRKNAKEQSYDLSYYTDYDQVRGHLVCRLVNYEKNQEMMLCVPHRRFLDLAVIYYYKMEDDTFGDASILVKNEHLEMWDADPEEIDDAAMSNTARLMPYECIYIADMIRDMTGVQIEEACGGQIPMYVLTNIEKCFGAAVLLYPAVLEAVGARLGGDFFVLPSSVHECMLVPVAEDLDPGELRKIVCEINEECVAPEEVLGDTVYRYCCERGELITAAAEVVMQ